MRFANQVAVVTGAASGLGLATAQRLISEGAQVLFVDRNAEALKTVSGHILAVDVREDDEPKQVDA